MKYKLGDKVRITGNKSSSCNKIGDEGIVTETDPPDSSGEYGYRVQKEGEDNTGNWSYESDLELVTKPITYTREDLLKAYELGRGDVLSGITRNVYNNTFNDVFPLPIQNDTSQPIVSKLGLGLLN